MSPLTHFDADGRLSQVDVGEKPPTRRRAVARGRLLAKPAVLRELSRGGLAKGDALAAARLAGILAAKRTAELIPLCHSLALDRVEVRLSVRRGSVEAEAEAVCFGRTGVEMEALTAVSVACLTLYDMLKAADKGMTIEAVRLIEKSGGRSGHWRAGEAA